MNELTTSKQYIGNRRKLSDVNSGALLNFKGIRADANCYIIAFMAFFFRTFNWVTCVTVPF